MPRQLSGAQFFILASESNPVGLERFVKDWESLASLVLRPGSVEEAFFDTFIDTLIDTFIDTFIGTLRLFTMP